MRQELNPQESPKWIPKPLLVSDHQAGLMLGVCERTIRNLIANGTLTRKYIGRKAMVKVADVEKLAQKGARTNSDPEVVGTPRKTLTLRSKG
jgi:hypothetical protein